MPPLRPFGNPGGGAFAHSIRSWQKTIADLFVPVRPTSSSARGCRSKFHTRANAPSRLFLNASRSRPAHTLTSPTRSAGRSSPPRARSRPHSFSFVPRRFNSTNTPQPKTLSFSQRMSKLSREYGWSALGIYLALSALDFPFCFAAVRLLGVERIGHYEHVVVEGAKRILGPIWRQGKDDGQEGGLDTGDMVMTGSIEGSPYDHGVVEAEKRKAEEGASIWTQLALAYAIHKSFIFIRVPLTAAVTPKVVRVLRRWGWDIGKRKPKSG